MTGFLPRLPVAARANAVVPLAGRSGLDASRLVEPEQPVAPLPLVVKEIDSTEVFAAISTPAADLVANG